jgi:hypothetical protein
MVDLAVRLTILLPILARLRHHWDITSNPISGSSDKRTREWKKLMSLYEQFLEFLRTGRDLPEQRVLRSSAYISIENMKSLLHDTNAEQTSGWLPTRFPAVLVQKAAEAREPAATTVRPSLAFRMSLAGEEL